ncbi:MAG: M23 family metallopeptidase [Spirochaetaceae bacterium]
MKWLRVLLPVAVIAVAAVVYLIMSTPPEVVEERFEPRASHANYREGMQRLGLEETYLARTWLRAADAAENDPSAAALPFSETLYFDPQDPHAVGYWFPVTRGRRIVIEFDAPHRYYFADVFRLEDGEELALDELVASRPPDGNTIRFEARSNGFYLLRLQPELLRGGRFQVTITESASLAFPVEGATPEDIWSFFGDGRDGGSRVHHGVDIFAPRGTPVLAASDSEVMRVGERALGGKVVTLYDEARGIMLYYAHLDEQLTTRGSRVRAGEVIGTVGNTGNAITTPPHLHIGIYQESWRRPVDPWAYFVDPPITTAGPTDPRGEELLAAWSHSEPEIELLNRIGSPRPPDPRRNRNPFLRGAGDTFAGAETEPELDLRPPLPSAASIAAGTPLRVTGVSGDRLRVRTINGANGFLPVETIPQNSEATTVDQSVLLRDIHTGDAFGVLEAGTTIIPITRFDGNEVVRLSSGRVAVIRQEEESAPEEPR